MFAGGIGGDSDLNLSDTSGIGGDLGGGIDADLGGIDIDIGGADADFCGADCAHGEGFHDPSDMPVSSDGSFVTLKLFTFQGILAFLASFSWISILCVSGGINALFASAIGLATGVLMMFAVAKLIQLLMKLSDDGTVNFENAVGIRATVYIPIPGDLAGEGKVIAEFQGAERECDAITAQKETIPTNADVVVTSVKGNTLIVERV
jgi:membrane protein implicated in regulation of membrane protease activity